MPKLLYARAPQDAREECRIRRLAASRHAPADWRQRAQMVVGSWAGRRTTQVAARLGCHPQTVRERLARFNAEGLEGLGDLPGGGRPPRLTEDERSRIIALVATDPPGKPVRRSHGEVVAADADAPAQWSLDALAAAAQRAGIAVGRSQVRRILVAEGVRWRRVRSWTTSADPEFAPKGRGSSGSTPRRRPARRASTWTSSGR
jgi:transposase